MLTPRFTRLPTLTALANPTRSMSTPRDQMISQIAVGSAGPDTGDASGKVILMRGCDPAMAQRAGAMLPPLLGNVKILAATDDGDFFKVLDDQGAQVDVVGFAPGACRWDAAKKPIPGGNDATKDWSMKQYREKVREARGEHIPIVETTEESQMVPLLRKALGLD